MPSSRAIKVADKPRRKAAVAEASYEHDFYAWSFAQASALRARRPEQLDWENLAEEIESLGKSDHRQVRSRLTIILMHLLKWQYQPEKRSTSWKVSVATQRDEIASLLGESPSLRGRLPMLLVEAYRSARELAILEMGLNEWDTSIPPKRNPFSLNQVLDDNFLPE